MNNMPTGQALEERSPVAFRFRFVRIEDRVLNPGFDDGAALDLEFRVIVVADHRGGADFDGVWAASILRDAAFGGSSG
jgi:hypothetical protein